MRAEQKADPGRVLYAFARLKPGITIAQATAQLQPVFDYSLSLAPARFRSEVHLRVRSMRDRQMQDVRLVAWILFGTVIAVLLIACANVASLLLTRAAARERELAVRSALGATRSRLIRQTLTESILLSFFGAIAGCVLAVGLLRLFVAIAPSSLPFLAKAQIDLRIVSFTIALAILGGIVVRHHPGHVPSSCHRTCCSRSAAAQTRALLRRSDGRVQIAASVILLAGAALLVRSFANLQNQALGMQIARRGHGRHFSQSRKIRDPSVTDGILYTSRSGSAPFAGSVAVASSDTIPPGGYHRDQIYSVIAVDGRPAPGGATGGMVTWRWVTPGYFNALDIPIVRGTGFNEAQRNSTDHFIILSNLLASRLFPRPGSHWSANKADAQ